MGWEYFPEWFRRRIRRPPFFRSWFFGDVEEMMRDIEEMMEREFKEFTTSQGITYENANHGWT